MTRAQFVGAVALATLIAGCGGSSKKEQRSGCERRTCAALGKNCGEVADGCGGTLTCGTCAAPASCGGGGVANVCGSAGACTATTCAALGKNCGEVADGCGGTLTCGTCTPPASCGGGGVANVCASPPAKGGETRWVRYVSGVDAEAPRRNLRVDGDGNLYTVGTTTSGAARLTVRKYTGQAVIAWERTFASPDVTSVEVLGFAVSPAGTVVFSLRAGCAAGAMTCGLDFGGGKLRSGFVKLTGDGSFEWQKTLGAPGVVAISATGDIVARSDPATDGGSFIVYDWTGATRWKGQLGLSQAFAFAPDGSLYVGWGWTDEQGAGCPSLSKLDTTGATIWTRCTMGRSDAVATSARGTPVLLRMPRVTAYEPNDGSQRFEIDTQMSVWDMAVQTGTADEIAVAVVGTMRQDFGAALEDAACGKLAVRKYDLDGQFEWSRLIGAVSECNASPQARGVAVRSDGEVVVSGYEAAATDLGTGIHTPEGGREGFLLGLTP